MKSDEFSTVLRKNIFTPVAVFNDVSASLKTVEILHKHDISIVEITLRTPDSLQCIEAVAKEFPDITVGAGSVFTPDALTRAQDCGAGFFVSPVFTPEIGTLVKEKNLPWIPGAATPNELFAALAFSEIIKVFPAHSLGGPSYIKAMTAPFKMMNFSIVPTGGINIDNMLSYLSLDVVINCGLSWVVDPQCVSNADWAEISRRISAVKDVVGTVSR